MSNFVDKIEFNDSSLMPYGKHAGERLERVPASYLIWAYADHLEQMRQPRPDAPDPIHKKWALRGYVESNLDHLEEEAASRRVR